MFNNNQPVLEFEKIKTKNGPQKAYRTKVPGGWFVHFETQTVDSGAGGAFFYPDPKHEWDGNSLT